MMSAILHPACLLVLAVSLFACTRYIHVETDPVTGFRTTYTLDPKTERYHGLYTKTDSSGVLLERGHMHQGLLHGLREFFFPDGTVEAKERYTMDRIDGLYEDFHPNGQVAQKGYYIQGEMSGLWRKYDANGTIAEEVMMIANEENGPFTEYYPDGKLKAEGTYLNGPKEDGTLKLYDEAGQLQKKMLCYEGICYTKWRKE